MIIHYHIYTHRYVLYILFQARPFDHYGKKLQIFMQSTFGRIQMFNWGLSLQQMGVQCVNNLTTLLYFWRWVFVICARSANNCKNQYFSTNLEFLTIIYDSDIFSCTLIIVHLSVCLTDGRDIPFSQWDIVAKKRKLHCQILKNY